MAKAKGHCHLLYPREEKILEVLNRFSGNSKSRLVGEALVNLARMKLDMAIWTPETEEIRKQLRAALLMPAKGDDND